MSKAKASKASSKGHRTRVRRAEHLEAFRTLLADLYMRFPGFADDTDVNGCDLVDFVSQRLKVLPDPKEVK